MRFYSSLILTGIFACALRTPIAPRTQGDPTTEDRARYSMVKAQGGARCMSMVHDCAACECGCPLSNELSEEPPVRPSAVKKRRTQLRITFHKPHLLRTLHPTSIAITSPTANQSEMSSFHFHTTSDAVSFSCGEDRQQTALAFDGSAAGSPAVSTDLLWDMKGYSYCTDTRP